MDGHELRAEYEAAVGPAEDGADRSALLAEVASLLSSARAAHPRYAAPSARFVRHVATLVGADAAALAAVRALHAADLFLAFACAEGDAAAAADFEDLLPRAALAAVGRLRLDPSRRDEVLQRVRIRLAVGDRTAKPKLLSYAGRGPLESWVRVAAVNVAYSFLEERGEQPWVALEEALSDAATDDDPELQALAHEHAETLRASVRAALEQLADPERAILRYKLLEDLSIDQIAAINGYDRATAARRIVRAKDNLRQRVQAEFCRRAAVTPSEFHSITRQLYSLLEVSIERLLGGDEASTAGRR